MATTRLPEIFNLEGGLTVRAFPGAVAMEFRRLPPAERRSTPAIVRRLFAAAAKHAYEEATCSVCGEHAPTEGRVLIAVETATNHDIGCICADCSGEFQAA